MNMIVLGVLSGFLHAELTLVTEQLNESLSGENAERTAKNIAAASETTSGATA